MKQTIIEFSFLGMWLLAGAMIIYVIFFGYPF